MAREQLPLAESIVMGKAVDAIQELRDSFEDAGKPAPDVVDAQWLLEVTASASETGHSTAASDADTYFSMYQAVCVDVQKLVLRLPVTRQQSMPKLAFKKSCSGGRTQSVRTLDSISVIACCCLPLLSGTVLDVLTVGIVRCS
jgi:hypothetical protein